MPKPVSFLFATGWRAAAVAAVALAAAAFMVIRPPSTAQASQPPTAVMGAPAEYVSSDPSLPPAASVKFPEPGPHIEAF